MNILVVLVCAQTVLMKLVYMQIRYHSPDEDKVVRRKIVLELYDKELPRTCNNFYAFIKGANINGVNMSYKNSKFHRIIKDFMIQGGDVVAGNGTGSISIYGRKFEDENFKYKHDKAGVLSMANSGLNSNGSQFFITVKETKWLNGRHVVFGRVVKDTLKYVIDISKTPTDKKTNKPLTDVIVEDCGDYVDEEKEVPGYEREL